MSTSGVSGHLGIRVDEYDARIRTFVPYYEHMIETIVAVLDAVASDRPVIVDLGIGTGALSACCRAVRPDARIIGIDADAQMLAIARARLGESGDVELFHENYLEAELPACDVIVSSLALHHTADAEVKQRLYVRCRSALRAGGAMLVGDCYRPLGDRLSAEAMAHWRAHLDQHYPPDEARGSLKAWSQEDTYFPLALELEWLRSAGFTPDVTWRADMFAVLTCATAVPPTTSERVP